MTHRHLLRVQTVPDAAPLKGNPEFRRREAGECVGGGGSGRAGGDRGKGKR